MRPALPVLVAAALAALAAGCAPGQNPETASAGARAERQCFLPAQITNFRADRQTLYLRAGHSAVYELQTAGACLDIEDSMQLAVVPQQGASWLCVGDRADVVGRSPSTPAPCRAFISRQLTDEEVAALPSRLKP